MNTQLIPVFTATIGDAPVNAVDARELHEFLEVRSEFRNWIKNRIADYGFVKDIDYIAGNFLPGSDRVDYHCSISMAKELAMVERTAKGKEARQYFIECERRAKDAATFQPQPARSDVLADSPFPRLHDALNRSLTLLTRPSSRYIQGIALAQTEQLCAQLGIALPDRELLYSKPTQAQDAMTQVLAAIRKAGPRGIRETQLTSVCWFYRKLSQPEQADLIQRLVDQGEVVWEVPPSQPGARRCTPVLVFRAFTNAAAA